MALETRSPEILRFGTFEVDLRSGELHKRGVRIKLQEQPFQVLTILLKRPGVVVTREELRSAIWQSDTFVDFDNGLNTSINKLREALGDSADNPRFIETLPRRGYRFIAPVNNDVQKPVPTPRPLKFVAQVVVAATAVAVVAVGLIWVTKRHPSSPPELKLWQITTNSDDNPVRWGAMSSDGKYLAYADPKKMYIKLIETGEIRGVAQPEVLQNQKISWQIISWFPDGTRFLVNAHPAGTGGEEWNSKNTSIWTVSALGEPPHKLRDEGIAYSVSPDGSSIAFGMNKGRLGEREIWLMGPNGDQARRVYGTDEDNAIEAVGWSPNGKRILYVAVNEAGVTMQSRDLNGGPNLTTFSKLEMENLTDWNWLPDGRFIYATREQAAIAETCNFWEVRLDMETGKPIGMPRKLTNWAGFCMTSAGVTADSKRLAFLKWQYRTSTYVADLEASGSHIGKPIHFTLTESLDLPVGWTADSKAILIMSSRSGHWGIYKQSLNNDTAEPLLTGLHEVRTPRVSPDGNWFLYGVPTFPGDESRARSIMRIPLTGGAPQLVVTARPHSHVLCARSPATLCVIGEPTEDRKQIILTAFDPVKGRGVELIKFDLDPDDDRWVLDLSPDGTRIAATRKPEGPIYILSLNGQPTREINVKGRKGMLSLDWAADGNGLYVSAEAPLGAELLYVDFQGNWQFLWKNRAGNYTGGLPSPDGRNLAIVGQGFDGNIWMMNNF
jgi:DNA-binding winged helix-turn-helix (wHTH) protein/Tol biopolymer transport system component